MISKLSRQFATSSDFKRSQVNQLFPAIRAKKKAHYLKSEKIMIICFFSVLFLELIIASFIH